MLHENLNFRANISIFFDCEGENISDSELHNKITICQSNFCTESWENLEIWFSNKNVN